MNDRIKLLAKAMGWREHDVDNVHKWMPPNYDKYEKRYAKSWVCLPNPENDANDCEALIDFLLDDEWDFTHEAALGTPRHYIQIKKNGRVMDWRGDNWKQGVCELALKVIENAPEESAIRKFARGMANDWND